MRKDLAGIRMPFEKIYGESPLRLNRLVYRLQDWSAVPRQAESIELIHHVLMGADNHRPHELWREFE